MAKKPLFKIDPDSEVKGTGEGGIYVTTTPDHPHGEKRPDRKKRYVYKHRVIMENQLGRLLKDGEEVHHKDEDRTNNAPSNLELAKLGPHQKNHALKNKFWKKSPANKPKRKKPSKDAAIRVAALFLQASQNQP